MTDLDWLLDDLVKRVAGAQRAVVLSRDGLLLGRSANLDRDDAERLSAVASGFQSLAKGTAQFFGGGSVRQNLVEMDKAYLLITAAGQGACLALLADEDADMGMIGYEMNVLVQKVGAYLSAQPRGDEVQPPTGPVTS